MKKIAIAVLGLALVGMAEAKDQAVKGDVKKDGTNVAKLAQAGPNANKADIGARGTVNPSAGKESVKDPYAVPLLREAKSLN